MLSLLKKFLGPAAIYGFASQVGSLITVLVLPIITPYLTKTDFGVSGIVIGYIGLVSALQNLGLPIILANSFYKSPHRYQIAFRMVLGFLHVWGFVYYLILGFILWLFIPAEAAENRWLIIGLLCGPGLVLGPVDIVGDLLFQLRQQPQWILAVTLVTALAAGAVNVYTVKVLKLGYMGFFYAFFTALLLKKLGMHYLITIRERMYPLFVLRYRYWRSRLEVSLPLIPHYYSVYLLNSSDKVVMDQLGVATPRVGVYDTASRFGTLFSAGSQALNKAAAPLMLKSLKAGAHREANNIGELMQIVLLVVTFVTALLMPEIFPLIIRSADIGMEGAILAVPIVMAYNYRGMYVSGVNVLFYRERTKKLWRITFVAGFFNVLLNLLLIPRFGVAAAAWTTLAAYLYVGYFTFFMKEYQELTVEKVRWHRYFVLTLVLTILAFYLVSCPLLIRLAVIGIFLFLAAAYLALDKRLMLNIEV